MSCILMTRGGVVLLGGVACVVTGGACVAPAARPARADALSAAGGIAGCAFVHETGFIGGNATYEGALAMALKTLELAE